MTPVRKQDPDPHELERWETDLYVQWMNSLTGQIDELLENAPTPPGPLPEISKLHLMADCLADLLRWQHFRVFETIRHWPV